MLYLCSNFTLPIMSTGTPRGLVARAQPLRDPQHALQQQQQPIHPGGGRHGPGRYPAPQHHHHQQRAPAPRRSDRGVAPPQRRRWHGPRGRHGGPGRRHAARPVLRVFSLAARAAEQASPPRDPCLLNRGERGQQCRFRGEATGNTAELRRSPPFLFVYINKYLVGCYFAAVFTI